MDNKQEKPISPERMAEFVNKLPKIKKVFMAIAGDSKCGSTPLEKFILAAAYVFGEITEYELKALLPLFRERILEGE
jgi:hypothetical protein